MAKKPSDIIKEHGTVFVEGHVVFYMDGHFYCDKVEYGELENVDEMQISEIKIFSPTSYSCKVCGGEILYGKDNSPMIQHPLWQRILQHYSLENRDTLICKDCMEKALGRSLVREDVLSAPLNSAFINRWFPAEE